MNVMISGSHGLIGSALYNKLSDEGHNIIRLTRTFSDPLNFKDIDAVVHLAGESIAEGRWNTNKKRRIESSRVDGTRTLTKMIAKSEYKPDVFISASAIGYYGNREDEKLTEDSIKGNGFLSNLCAKWEDAAQPAEEVGVRVVKIRTGIVLDAKGGALNKMLPPFKMGGGGILGSGRQFMSWISLTDMVNAILFIIRNVNISGPVNMSAPNPVTNYEFTKTLGAILKKSTIIPLPAFVARILFGEMADALLLSSTRVEPAKLLEAGYCFEHTDLKSALQDILK